MFLIRALFRFFGNLGAILGFILLGVLCIGLFLTPALGTMITFAFASDELYTIKSLNIDYNSQEHIGGVIFLSMLQLGTSCGFVYYLANYTSFFG